MMDTLKYTYCFKEIVGIQNQIELRNRNKNMKTLKIITV